MNCRWIICVLLVLSVAGCKKAERKPDAITENAIGLPFYPKSTEWGTGSTKAQEGDSATTSSSRETGDAPDKVVAFYKKKIKNAKVTANSFGDIARSNITGQAKDGGDVEILVMKMPQRKTQIFVSVTRKIVTSKK